MSEFPAKARLQLLLNALVEQLPEQFGTLLDSDRFVADRKCLHRFGDPQYLQTALSHINDAEAEYLADMIQVRWSRIGRVTLQPAVAVVAPEQVWLGSKAGKITLHIATMGIDDDWQAEWLGDVVSAPDTRSAEMTVAPFDADNDRQKEVSVKVSARQHGKRCLLVAKHKLEIRKPLVEISADHRCLKVSDHRGKSAGEVEVMVGTQLYRTQKNGLLELENPISLDATVHVAGVKISVTQDAGNEVDIVT